ncbi:T9SS type A sorting domain-containing protein [candidate division KSB1 bacterium]|nr:T9SS type A sorting domain-containing protein [candidate division KSB1 bacterium]
MFSAAVIKAKGNPIKPKIRNGLSASSNEFVCGTYKGSEKEILWRHYQYQAKLKSLQKSGGKLTATDFVFDDVWVAEDDGTLLTSGVNLFDTDNETFHFVPNASGGYDVTNITFAFDSDFGTDLSLGDDANTTINMPFTFNYYANSWNDIHVNANGIVSFGADINPSGFFDNNDFVSELPKIAAYFMDLNPAEPGAPADGGVFAKSEADTLTITWNKLPEFGTSKINTVQLALHSDGSIDVSFNGITSVNDPDNNTPITFGIYPGGNEPNTEIISFSDDLPFSGPVGAAIFETYLDLTNPRVNANALINRFYQTYPDSFFQAVFFTNFQQTMRGFANSRTIKTNIQGIGVRTRDGSQAYGSNGVLESYCNMNRLSIWRSNPEERFFTDGNNFLTILAQESGHRWGVHVNFIDTNSDTSDLILGRDNGHWSYYFDSDHSSLEGGNWEFSFGNTFTTPTQVDFFGDIDEYIMGLRTPEEVTPSFFVSSPTNDLLSSRERGTPRMGAFASGTAVEVTIGDIIAAEGPRLPAEADAPKDLRQAFILVIQNGTTPSQNELDKIANFRRTWEDYFERSVGGRMTLNTSITRIFPVALLSGHVLDDMTDQPIVNITVKSTERGFEQSVPGGGRYTFRYLADESSGAAEAVRVIVEAEGYFSDTLTTNITYGTEMVSDFRLQPDLTSVENVASEIPAFDLLEQNYPNPFNPSTTIKFDLSVASEVTLNIYNMKGQLVRQLLQEKLSAGSHSFTWDAKDDHAQQLPSGLYVSRLQAGDFVQHRKMLLIK